MRLNIKSIECNALFNANLYPNSFVRLNTYFQGKSVQRYPRGVLCLWKRGNLDLLIIQVLTDEGNG